MVVRCEEYLHITAKFDTAGETIMIRVSDDKKFKRRSEKYSDAVDLVNARILTGAAKITSKSPYRLEIAASSR